MKLAGATLCGHGEKASIFFRRAETVDHNREREKLTSCVSKKQRSKLKLKDTFLLIATAKILAQEGSAFLLKMI